MSDSASIQAIRLSVSDKVRALLSRHGNADQKQQLATLMTIMSASYSQVYRKISGRSSWLEEDLFRIAQHFGETLGGLFSDTAHPPAHAQGPLPELWHAAKVQVGSQLIDCQVAVDADPSTTVTLVLENTPHGLRVVPVADAADDAIIGMISHLRMDLAEPAQGGFAVLDDDPDVADAIVDTLLSKGLDAQAFYAKEDLQAASRQFDTYILDWFSDEASTTADLVAYLRTTHAPQATIVILTGQIQRDKAESDLSKMILTHDVMVELKPMRLDLLLAKIEHARHAV